MVTTVKIRILTGYPYHNPQHATAISAIARVSNGLIHVYLQNGQEWLQLSQNVEIKINLKGGKQKK